MKYKVLWIEDGAFVEVDSLVGPVLITAQYDLDIALNASDAIKMIQKKEYDVIIVDIRIPPGSDPGWENYSELLRRRRLSERLGLTLLFSLLRPGEDDSITLIQDIPDWIKPEKFAVFTIDGKHDVESDLEKLSIPIFKQKETRMPNTALLELIEQVIKNTENESIDGGA